MALGVCAGQYPGVAYVGSQHDVLSGYIGDANHFRRLRSLGGTRDDAKNETCRGRHLFGFPRHPGDVRPDRVRAE